MVAVDRLVNIFIIQFLPASYIIETRRTSFSCRSLYQQKWFIIIFL